MQKAQRVEGRGRLTTKEKAAAPHQITAEQLLREAAALQTDEARPPARRLVDEDELNEYRVRKRKYFEDSLRRRRQAMPLWTSYALWESEQHDFRRARSVFERALEIDQQNTNLWNKYLDMEEKNKFISSARNLYDRITTMMPRVDHFWLRYTKFEETLANYAGVRAIFERWMEFEPEDRAWLAYVKFEERCGELELARRVMERFLVVHPRIVSFMKFAKFEEDHRNFQRARAAYEKAVEVLPQEELTESFYIKFARFEERRHEFSRVKAIYLEGIRRLGPSAEGLAAAYISFQKRFGEKEEVENVVTDRRRLHYEELLEKTQFYDYDLWLSLIWLEEARKDIDRIREVYERAVKMVPLSDHKAGWKRYFYIWYSYAIFEELEAKDIDKARSVWLRLKDVIPHAKFSFAKLWTGLAHFELRQGNLQAARLAFGEAIAQHPVAKIFSAYCDMELKMGEMERCRKICAKFVEVHPNKPQSWLALIDLELLGKEYHRARNLFELAIDNAEMETAEVMWKAYIDMEANLKHFDAARELFERLIQKTQHWEVFRSLAEFEWKTVADVDRARKAYHRGVDVCKENEQDEERATLLECWLRFEQEVGDQEKLAEVQRKQPRKVRKRRTIQLVEGGPETVEEYTAYEFADEAGSASSLGILEAVKKWKKRKLEEQQQQSSAAPSDP